ncbi:hypothetical protein [Parasitella parasitica]|uniref:Uncharacterized protein n=1 Tax=Parasitella parasitica TaxID=35722 RepID=A0A0B7MZU9_9FUNG|nr:hypothetical protein [Parasitella parasitica]
MLDGCAENWDLYLDGTAYSLNLHKSRLHDGMKPFAGMFARLPNELKDYSVEQVHLPEQELDTKALKNKIKRIDKVLVPAIKEQIVRTQKADNAYFMKRHRILEKPFPIGASVMIKNNGSYILKDKTNTFLSGDVPTSQIKLIDAIPNPEDNPQAIINHRGEAPNYEYLVRWKAHQIILVLAQGATNNDSSNKRKRAPKSVNKRKVATREERSTKRHARLINKRRPTDTTTP